jgi:hypothetical protein
MLRDLISDQSAVLSDRRELLSDRSVITQPLLSHQPSLSSQRAVLLSSSPSQAIPRKDMPYRVIYFVNTRA